MRTPRGAYSSAELVGDLSIRDPHFRQWWVGTHVAVKRRGTRIYNHPVVGEIALDWDALTSVFRLEALGRPPTAGFAR
jgi:hypothetical protein